MPPKGITSFRGEYWYLSNFYPAEVRLDGLTYPTVEHAYQAAKTLDKEEREKIRKAKGAAQAKFLGQQVKLRKHWDKQLRLDTMKNLLRQKFRQRGLKEKLLATGELPIVEGNWWGDTFWGVTENGGENWLGKLIMDIREELR